MKRRAQRDRIAFAEPWFRAAAPDAHGRPKPQPETPVWIATFRSGTFIEDFFAAAAGSDSGWTPGAWEQLVYWRDFAEPPKGMLAADGEARYPEAGAGAGGGAGAGTIGRRPFLAQEAIVSAHGARVVIAPGTSPAGMPSAEQERRPWLRKLYLPLHQHFHVVSCGLVCRRFDAPRMDPDRLVRAGMVVRRLMADPERERWQDWIESPGGGGAWVEVADSSMNKLHGSRSERDDERLDPENVGGTAFASVDVAAGVRARLGVGGGEAMRLGSARLSPMPVEVGLARDHTTLFGYLPLPQGDKEVPRDALSASQLEVIRAELIQQARDPLRANVAERLPGILAAGRRLVRDLMELVVLPPDPGPGPAADDDGLAAAVNQMWANSGEFSPPGDWWPGLFPVMAAQVRERVLRRVYAFLSEGLSDTLPADQLPLFVQLICTMLRRGRSARIRLAAKVFSTVLPDEFPGSVDQVEARLREGATVSSLADELSAWLHADDESDVHPRPWAPLNLDAAEQLGRKAHEKLAELEILFTDVDRQGSGAGPAYVQVRNDLATALPNTFNLPATPDPVPDPRPGPPAPTRFDLAGISLDEQPARGLLVFPTLNASASKVEELITAVTNLITLQEGRATRAEAKARDEVTRPRYDSNSLYGVWCWARITGMACGEEERIVWSKRSEVFSIAEPLDILGLRPTTIQLPDLGKLVRDIPRIARAGAQPYAAVNLPPNSDVEVGETPQDTSRKWGVGWICSFGIPVFTICAWVLFQFIFSILLVLGFGWFLLLKFCIPIPKKE